MDQGRRNKGRIVRSLMICALVFLGLCFPGPKRLAVADDARFAKGIVGTVSGNLIYLNGKSVDLTGIPVRNAAGEELSLADITPGKKVGLCYRRGRISSVLVFEPMVE